MVAFIRNSDEETPAPLFGALVAGHYAEPYGYSVYRGAGTQDWLIACTSHGLGYFVHDDTVLTVGARDILLIPPGTMHQYGTVEASVWNFHWAHFIPCPNWAGWLRMIQGEHNLRCLHIEDDEAWRRVQTAFAKVLADSMGMGQLADELALNGIEEILLVLSRSLPDADESTLDPRIRSTLRYIAEHMAEPLTVPGLASRVDLSPSRFAHLFKEQMQDSVTNTLIKLRLRQAARLLQFTSRKVTDIAHDVGFESSFYFTRKFTSQFGMSPTEYRRVHAFGDQERG